MKSSIIITVTTLAGLASTLMPTEYLGIGILAVVKPGLGEKVPVGAHYLIVWVPDSTCEFLDIIFFMGPESNVVPVGTIASNITDYGYYKGWVPDPSLPDSTEGFQLQLLCVEGLSVGEYQWSSQFGFLNPGGTPDTSPLDATSSMIVGPSSSEKITTTPGSTPMGDKISNSTIFSTVTHSSGGKMTITPGGPSGGAKVTYTTSTQSTGTSTTINSSVRLSNGVIIGITISAVVALGIVAGLIMFIVKHRWPLVSQPSQVLQPTVPPYPHNYLLDKPELPAGNYPVHNFPPQELPHEDHQVLST